MQPTLLGFCALAAAENVTALRFRQMLRSTGSFPRGSHPPARHRLIPSRRSPITREPDAEASDACLIAAPPRTSFPQIRSLPATYCSLK